MRFERADTLRILERQSAAVQVVESGRMVDLLQPSDAVRVLRSQPHVLCFGRGTTEQIKFITIRVEADLQAAMIEDLAPKLPKVHGTPQRHPLGWTQQPLRARSGRMGGH